MGLTPAQILSQTNDRQLASNAEAALDALRQAGIYPDETAIDWGAIFAAGRSTADEYGLNKRTLKPEPGTPNLMQRIADLILVMASVSDPDGTAPIVFVGNDAVVGKQGERVNLDNHQGWIDRNRPETRGSSNIAAGMELMLQIIAAERNQPALAAIATNNEPMRIAMKPYAVPVVVEGDPDDPYRVQRLLHLTARTNIHWVFVYVSNQRVGLEVYKDILQGISNVTLVDFPRGLVGVSDDAVFRCLASGLKF